MAESDGKHPRFYGTTSLEVAAYLVSRRPTCPMVKSNEEGTGDRTWILFENSDELREHVRAYPGSPEARFVHAYHDVRAMVLEGRDVRRGRHVKGAG